MTAWLSSTHTNKFLGVIFIDFCSWKKNLFYAVCLSTTAELGLKVACHNIRGLVCKLDQLKLLLDCDVPPLDVYCLNETFLTSNIAHSHLNSFVEDIFLSINGYGLVRNDRRHKEGGGVLMYIRNGLPFKRRCDLECNLIEIMTVLKSGSQTNPYF